MSQPMRYTNPNDCLRFKVQPVQNYKDNWECQYTNGNSVDNKGNRTPVYTGPDACNTCGAYIGQYGDKVITTSQNCKNIKFQAATRPDGSTECQRSSGNLMDNNGNLLPSYDGIAGCMECVARNAGGVSGPSERRDGERDSSERDTPEGGKVVDTATKKNFFQKLSPASIIGIIALILVLIGLFMFLRKKQYSFSYCGMSH